MDPQSSTPLDESQPIIPPTTQQQSQLSTVILTIILTLTCVAVAYFGYQEFKNRTQQRGCTMEAKICPDGSAVGRSGPKCEFTPCPTIPVTPTSNPTSNWKTYTNKDFSFRYPDTWKMESNKIFSPEDNIEMWAYASGDSLYNECMKLTNTQIVGTISVKHFSGITNSEMCDPANVSKRETWIVKSTSDGFAPGLQYSYKSNNTAAEEIFNQILSTFKFNQKVIDPQLESVITQLKQLIANQNFTQIANLIQQTEITCDSQGPYYNPEFCKDIPDGGKKSGYSVGYYQSEGTTQDKDTFISGLRTFFMGNEHPSYLGAIISNTPSSPSGLIWKNTSNNGFLSFFVIKTTTSWIINGTLIGDALPEILRLEKFW